MGVGLMSVGLMGVGLMGVKLFVFRLRGVWMTRVENFIKMLWA